MKTLRIAPIILIFAALITPLRSEDLNKGFLTGLTGGYLIPGGFYANTFDPGPGFGATLLFYPGWYGFFLEGTANFASFAMQASPNSTMSQYTMAAGPGFAFSLTRWFEPFVSLQGGVSHMRFSFDQSGLASSATKPFGIATAGIMISPFDFISLRFGASYGVSTLSGETLTTTQFSGSAMMRLSVFTGRNILDRRESLVQLSGIRLKPIFGARYMKHEASGVGTATVTNNGGETLSDVRIETAINEIASGPTKSEIIKSLPPGKSVEVDLPLSVSREILKLNETRELPVKLRTYYTCEKGTYSYVEAKSITVHSRNALTWNNVAHIGSFITPREEAASSFSRNAISQYKKNILPGFNKKLQESLIIFDAIGAAGISYATDPNTGYGKKDEDSIDYVMFSGETLRKKAGDCDDLTALYASLLEAVGIKTAVITVPGHIFMMFDTEVPQNSYTDITDDRSLLYFMNGTAWVPVEVTMTGKSFLSAWKEGAASVEKYREKAGEFETFETARAWAKFPPADIGSGDASVPSKEKIDILYTLDMDELRTRGYDVPVRKHLADLGNDAIAYNALNSLGILNAKHGKLDEAFSFLKKAIDRYPERSPAYANLGNIYILKKNFENACPMFEKAASLNPENHKYRISLARAYFETGKRFKAKEEYREALKANPGYARRYAYLDSDPNVRAADPEERAGYNMWEK
jgi:hypothetical protein